MVVVSEGRGREWLESEAGGVPGLTLLDYQPYEQLPDMLAKRRGANAGSDRHRRPRCGQAGPSCGIRSDCSGNREILQLTALRVSPPLGWHHTGSPARDL